MAGVQVFNCMIELGKHAFGLTLGNGHCSFFANGRLILRDCYPDQRNHQPVPFFGNRKSPKVGSGGRMPQQDSSGKASVKTAQKWVEAELPIPATN